MKTHAFLSRVWVLALIPRVLLGQALQVWTPEPWEMLSDETPPAPPPPHVRMAGGRNGWASGLVAARGEGMLSSPRVEVSDLRHESGVTFPARFWSPFATAPSTTATRSGNATRRREGDYFPPLHHPAPEETRTLVARLTAEIPANAPPGVYRGQAVVNANGRHTVPVTLTVGEGSDPLPRSTTSPTSTIPTAPTPWPCATGTDMWSREHWEKLDASFGVFRLLGQNVVHVPVILHSERRGGNRSNPNHFGSRHGMIRFQLQGNQVVPDFTVFETFLARWRDRVGPPQFIVLYVWDISFANHERDHFDGLQAVVTGVDARGHPLGTARPLPRHRRRARPCGAP
jgi:hypothetical protein